MGARIVKQKYNVNNNNTNKNVMIPKKINKKTIEYREYVNKNVSKILLNTNNNRNDIYCKLSIDPQKDANNILNVLGTFKKDIDEIKIALGGNKFHTEDNRKFSYEKSFIVLLISKKSQRSVSVALVVEHSINKTKKSVWELIWFSTKDRKRNQQYGQLLFQLIIDFAFKLRIDKIIVTAAKASVLWWYQASLKMNNNFNNSSFFEKECIYTKLSHSDLYQALIKLSIEDDNLQDDKIKKRRRKMQKLQKEFSSKYKLKDVPTKQQDLYSYYEESKPFTGKPYRYSILRTFHLWFSMK